MFGFQPNIISIIMNSIMFTFLIIKNSKGFYNDILTF